MSSIGKNIRKIRTIKGLSQTSFANLFHLTRASISAYEELRAEPKMDVTLEIAKYFNIPIEELLSHEITVNEFSKFTYHQVVGESTTANDVSIPIVTSRNWDHFLEKDNIENFQTMNVPSQFFQGEIAFVVGEKISSDFHSGTILLCNKETSVAENYTYLTIKNKQATVLKSNRVTSDQGQSLYRILQTIEEPNSNSVEERLKRLELQVEILMQKK
jgi:transcriptional regulator with XRE-family HTH domain